MIDSSPTTLYRLYAADDSLLYVGIAGNPGRRWEQHAGVKPWWGHVSRTTCEHFPTREAAARAELVAIRTENPKHNIAGARGPRIGSAVPTRTPPNPETAPYRPGTLWTWKNKRSGHARTERIELLWELNGSTISDDYWAHEITAYDLWREWRGWLDDRGGYDDTMGKPWVHIYWYVEPASEMAPFEHNPLLGEDFLTFFTWPLNAETGERLNWNRVPVADVRWTPDQSDKGGFVQEATGWKPSPLQPHVNVDTLAVCAGMVPDFAHRSTR